MCEVCVDGFCISESTSTVPSQQLHVLLQPVTSPESSWPHFSAKQTCDLLWSSLQREMDHEVKTQNDFHCVAVSRCLAVVVFMVAVFFTIYYVVI